MNDQIHRRLGELLTVLQVAMESVDLWETDEPTEEALASTEPFCMDTMSFEQWLRYVLINRFAIMAEHQLPLPTQCSVAPMAEEALKDLPAQSVIDALVAVDQLLTEESQEVDV